MKYYYYRCDNNGCGAVVTAKQIKNNGCCKVCGGRNMKYAYWRGFNLPKPKEWPLILLGLR